MHRWRASADALCSILPAGGWPTGFASIFSFRHAVRFEVLRKGGLPCSLFRYSSRGDAARLADCPACRRRRYGPAVAGTGAPVARGSGERHLETETQRHVDMQACRDMERHGETWNACMRAVRYARPSTSQEVLRRAQRSLPNLTRDMLRPLRPLSRPLQRLRLGSSRARARGRATRVLDPTRRMRSRSCVALRAHARRAARTCAPPLVWRFARVHARDAPHALRTLGAICRTLAAPRWSACAG